MIYSLCYFFYNWRNKFVTLDTKPYVPVVILSAQNNVKLLQQLKRSFKRTFNWYKYQSKVLIETKEPYLDYKLGPSFQRVNKIFVLSFENNEDRKTRTGHFLPKVEIKDYNAITNRQNFLDQLVKSYGKNLITFKQLE